MGGDRSQCFTLRLKLPNGPETGPDVFSNFHVHCDFRLVENLAFATCLYHGGVFWHFISIEIYENSLLIAVGAQKCMLNTLKIRYVFGIVLRFATAPAILFHHFNLRTIFAVISHTSAFRCAHCHCQALTCVMIIGLWLDRLPGSIFLQAFQQLSIVPVCASSKHLWAASLDTARSLCKLAFGVVHKTHTCTT